MEIHVAKIDLSKLSLDDLKKLRKDVEKAISDYDQKLKKQLRAELEAKVKEYGMTLEEVVGTAKSKAKAKAPAKFREPGNPSNTWSGRGRQPDWFKQAIAAGKSEDELLIKPVR